MRHIRAIFRIILIAVSTVFMYAVYVVGLLFGKLFNRRYEYWRNFCMRNWAHVVAMLINMKITPVGTPPSPPFFLVSNHLSYIDIIPLFYTLKCTFIAKKDVQSWPVVGYMVKNLGVIFVDRTKKTDVKRVNRLISESLNSQQGIILFPEGTTSPGSEVLPFRPSLLEHPAASNVPVHYSSVTYKTSKADLPAAQSVCWWGDISFPSHVYKLAGNKRIECTIEFGEEAVQENDRKQLADILHDKVSGQFTPVTTDNQFTEQS